VKHAAHLVRGQVEVRAARIRNDEAKPVGMRRDTAGDEIELVRNEKRALALRSTVPRAPWRRCGAERLDLVRREAEELR